jgi:hypothetical protein
MADRTRLPAKLIHHGRKKFRMRHRADRLVAVLAWASAIDGAPIAIRIAAGLAKKGNRATTTRGYRRAALVACCMGPAIRLSRALQSRLAASVKRLNSVSYAKKRAPVTRPGLRSRSKGTASSRSGAQRTQFTSGRLNCRYGNSYHLNERPSCEKRIGIRRAANPQRITPIRLTSPSYQALERVEVHRPSVQSVFN